MQIRRKHVLSFTASILLFIANGWAQSQDIPLILHVEPVHYEVKAGEDVKWYLTASGHEPLQYQWKFNGKDIPNATSKTLNLSSVKAENEGAYTCQVSNNVGMAESQALTLTLNTGTTKPKNAVAGKTRLPSLGASR